jgi:hypothetical protein
METEKSHDCNFICEIGQNRNVMTRIFDKKWTKHTIYVMRIYPCRKNSMEKSCLPQADGIPSG